MQQKRAQSRMESFFVPLGQVLFFGFVGFVLMGSSPLLAQSFSRSTGDVTGIQFLYLGFAFGIGLIITCFLAALINYTRLRKARMQIESYQADISFYRDHSFDAFLRIKDQCVLLWDDPQESPRIFGRLFGGAISRLDDLENWLAPQTWQNLQTPLGQLLANGNAFECLGATVQEEFIALRGIIFSGHAMLEIDVLSDSFVDLAQHRHRGDILENKLDEWRSFLTALPAPFWVYDENGAIIWGNEAYRQLVGPMAESASLPELLNQETLEKIQTSGDIFEGEISTNLNGERYRFQLYYRKYNNRALAFAKDISEQNELRSALNQLAAGHSETLDLLSSAVAVFNTDMKLKFFNQSFVSLWPLDRAFLETAPSHALVLDRLRENGQIAEQPNWRQWQEELFSVYRSVETVQHIWNLPDGRTLRVLAHPQPQGGVTWLFENLTEKLDLEARYNTLIKMQGETLDHLSEGVVVFGADGRLRLSNPAFKTVWALPHSLAEEGTHISEIAKYCRAKTKDDNWHEFIEWVTGFSEQRDAASGRIYLQDDHILDFAFAPLPQGQVMLTFVDVTANVRYAQTLRQNNELLLATDILRNDFIQHVSYELRTPLTNIIGFSDLMKTPSFGTLNERQREYLDHIGSQSMELLNIVNDILDLATVDAGIMKLHVEKIDISDVMKSSMARFEERLEMRGVHIKRKMARNLPEFYADNARLRQILNNVLSNAADFAPPQSTIDFTCEKDGDQILFSVHDNGCGIPDDILQHVFKRFSSHSHHGTRAGAGLGLSIVKSFVELHGGSVDIKTGEGQGTTVCCCFPLVPVVHSASDSRGVEKSHEGTEADEEVQS